MKIPIEKMITEISKRVESFKRDYQPKYVKNSSFVKDNDDLFTIDEYNQLTKEEQQRYRKLITYEYKHMPDKRDLQHEYQEFKKNFNKMLEKEGDDFRVNDRNARDFIDFIEYTDSIIKRNKKYWDSRQVTNKFQDYMKVKNDKTIEEYYNELLKGKKEETGV